MKNFKKNLLALIAVSSIMACVKEPSTPSYPVEEISKNVIVSINENVIQVVYSDLKNVSQTFNQSIVDFCTNPTDIQLNQCQNLWKETRRIWEHSEAFLFGPVATENIDPRIDTWPVNFTDLEGELAGSAAFTPEYIDGLQDALKGFHPIEYLLFGLNGNKNAADFTPRELEYLLALTINLNALINELNNHWNISQNSYANQLTQAGSIGSIYASDLAVYEEIINALVGICEEVAEGKMSEPFILQDPSLEESPYSSNSIIDFTNNIRGVEAIYLGNYNNNGLGIEDFVTQYNLSLDIKIKNDLALSIAALNNITLPFGQAILDQPQQVQTAIDAIMGLKATLESDLIPFIQQRL